jgi:hypothetical protein
MGATADNMTMSPHAPPPAAPPGAPTLFQCVAPGANSPAQKVAATIALGAILGGVGWVGMDATVSVGHIAGWLIPAIAVVSLIVWFGTRDPILAMGVDGEGLTVVRQSGRRTIAWADVEAARIQDYSAGQAGNVRYLLLRAGGKTYELEPTFADEPTEAAFEDALRRELDERDIPETSDGLPSFERVLSLGGAGVFVAAIVGLLAAHAMGYHTLGTIFGGAFLLTGSVVAWMTRGQRISRVILAATLLLILGGGAILWACHVNVREELQKWDAAERRR